MALAPAYRHEGRRSHPRRHAFLASPHTAVSSLDVRAASARFSRRYRRGLLVSVRRDWRCECGWVALVSQVMVVRSQAILLRVRENIAGPQRYDRARAHCPEEPQ
jgi:hypothetical protein